jgi:hypothetical protein
LPGQNWFLVSRPAATHLRKFNWELIRSANWSRAALRDRGSAGKWVPKTGRLNAFSSSGRGTRPMPSYLRQYELLETEKSLLKDIGQPIAALNPFKSRTVAGIV